MTLKVYYQKRKQKKITVSEREREKLISGGASLLSGKSEEGKHYLYTTEEERTGEKKSFHFSSLPSPGDQPRPPRLPRPTLTLSK